MNGQEFDVIIIGAGAAGSAAAAMLAGMNRRVGLIEKRSYPFKDSRLRWLSVGAAEMLTDLGVSATSFRGNSIQSVTFHSADFTKAATPEFKEPPGYVVQRNEVENALIEAAVNAGVTLISEVEIEDLRLQESAVCADLQDGRTISGRLQLLAMGSGSQLLERSGFSRSSAGNLGCSAQVDVNVTGNVGGSVPRLHLILGLDAAGSFGTCCLRSDCMSTCVNWKGSSEQSMETLTQLCQKAHLAGLLPLDPFDHPAHRKSVARLGVGALDMDTHVGKHTMLIGQAGGFIAAASYEGIYPAMWSARIAAEVAQAALDSVHSQDELMTFNSKWRIKMAEYLRPPNTDSQFLLPLVFSNQPMTDRMGAAFFFGENI